MGHATRCIPIINELLKMNIRPVIISSGVALEKLKTEFNHLPFEEYDPYNVHYKGFNISESMIRQSAKFLNAIKKEQEVAENLVNKYNAIGIISDNRYGFYSKKVPSIFITHQINIQAPFLQSFLKKKVKQAAKNFYATWIPDYNDSLLSGDLSTHPQFKTQFIGPLSQFNKPNQPVKKDIDWLAILSGPEPLRTKFENHILHAFSKIKGKKAIVRGVSTASRKPNSVNIDIYNQLPADKLNHLLNRSKYVVSRSGYTSIMDYHILGKSSLLIPTPGQTEQEYLAKLHANKAHVYQKESQLNLQKAQIKLDEKQSETIFRKSLLNESLKEFIDYAFSLQNPKFESVSNHKTRNISNV